MTKGHIGKREVALVEALEWAVNEFDGKTRYDSYQQRENCIEKCRALLSTLGSQAVEPEREDAEDCQRCGGNNPSWSAPSPLWNAVVRGGSIDGHPMFRDMLCIRCFVELAEGAGVARNWRLSATDVAVPLETVTPSGRVWNDETWLWEDALPASPIRREGDESARSISDSAKGDSGVCLTQTGDDQQETGK